MIMQKIYAHFFDRMNKSGLIEQPLKWLSE